MDALELAADNAAHFWTLIGTARGYDVRRHPGLLAVDGDERAGLRVLTLAAGLPQEGRAALDALLPRPGRVVVEDAFGAVELTARGMSSRQMPVMIRLPGEPVGEPALPVRRVTTPDELRTAERLVVEGFALEHFQPWTPGVVLPPVLLEGAELYLAHLDGEPAGACLVVEQDEAVGVYFVTTMPQFRSRGVGRALMHALLRRFDDRPVTLTASRLGRPLYESLGFERIADAAWWS
ncbi:GNAT family N-acetyltransferase [Dactylosporangium salmoneum]|uniref:N-acetyltransferase domain-containing protein n=1 Tax=Dactylosporangium salmoneum TaxID=53361 RepID=A0ABP5SQD3_9ACTN